MVELLVRLTASADRSLELIQALRNIRRRLQAEGICQEVDVSSDAEDPHVIWFREEWQAIDDFERRVRSQPFARLLSVIETAAAMPLIECRLVSETRGLEYLAALRGAAVSEKRNRSRTKTARTRRAARPGHDDDADLR